MSQGSARRLRLVAGQCSRRVRKRLLVVEPPLCLEISSVEDPARVYRGLVDAVRGAIGGAAGYWLHLL